MKLWLRAILALVSTAVSYAFYVSLPEYMLNLPNTMSLPIADAEITIGNFTELVFYIKSIGFMIVGVSFAHSLSEKGDTAKPIFHLFRVLLKIIFYGLFIFVEFSVIEVASVSYGLYMSIDITVLIYFMMGGVVLDLILTILDFFITFLPKKSEDKAMEEDL